MIANAMLIPPDKLGTPRMSDSPFSLLPTASNHAASLDGLYIFLNIVCFVSFVLVIGAMVHFMIKYKKRSDNDKTSPLTHNGRLEFIWSAVPAVFLMVFFVWGSMDFVKMSMPPSDAIDIKVTGQKWNWTFEYAGKAGPCVHAETGAPLLVVPKDRPVKTTMTSIDVLHSFYIPAFRVKKDVVPGRYTSVWFTAIEEGEFPLFCTEYCGDEHSSMLARVHVVPWEKYDEEVEKCTKFTVPPGMTDPQAGEKLYNIYGCNACHSTDGTPRTGPSFKGLFGKTETLASGTVKVDENYIRESILNPGAEIVSGYSNQMPSFQGKLDDQNIDYIISFIKSLK